MLVRRLLLSRRFLVNQHRCSLASVLSSSSNPRRVRTIDSARTDRARAMASSPSRDAAVRYCDIGANLCDPMFQGIYGGKRYHDPDLPNVLSRAAAAGVERIIVTAGSLSESEEAAEMAASSRRERGEGEAPPRVELYCSAGVHPTRAGELVVGGGGGEDASVDAAAVGRLRRILRDGIAAPTPTAAAAGRPRPPCVALGETGLDYARLQFCDAGTQRIAFGAQLDLAAELGGALPLFLHLRDAGDDFVEEMSKPRRGPSPDAPAKLRGVVHSFDGGVELMRRVLSMGGGACGERDLYIGINGCSLRDEGGLEVAREVPLDRLLLETDAPWCDLRPTHASANQEGFDLKGYDEAGGVVWKDKKKLSGAADGGRGAGVDGGGGGGGVAVMIKGRNEPSRVAAVASAVAAARGVPVEVVARAAWENSERLFFSP